MRIDMKTIAALRPGRIGSGTRIDTGVDLVVGRVYHFDIDIDPVDFTYSFTIEDDVTGLL